MSAMETAPEIVKAIVSAAPKGCYQRALVDGREPWSGAGLRGKARQFGAVYAQSRRNLVRRIDAQLKTIGWSARSEIVKTDRARRVLVLVCGEQRVIWG